MRKSTPLIIAFALLLMALAAPAATTPPAPGRVTTPFDAGWRFQKDEVAGAEQPAFNDAAWTMVDVPHDWVIAGTPEQNANSGRGGGYLPNGIGWYRKTFTLPAEDANRRIAIYFGGIMANSQVWINGFPLGQRPSGYASLYYDLTGHLNFGADKPNVLAVRADNSLQPASRYYTGGGIYRHVNLIATDPVHVVHDGLFVTTPKVTAEQATVHTQTTVTNDGDAPKTVAVKTTILGPDGQPVGSAVSAPHALEPGKAWTAEEDVPVTNPKLWNLDHPTLYQATAQVVADTQPLDTAATTFGIRTIEFKPESGFWLNGKNIKLLGVCLHQDGGAIGEAVPLSIYEHRLTAMKAMGANAVRWAHNPPSPALLDLCDRLGILVMDEAFDTWTQSKPNAEKGYNLYFKQWYMTDFRDYIARDRNHPSIIFYSLGNEIHDNPNSPATKEYLAAMLAAAHELDPTRPVTQALVNPEYTTWYTNGLADTLDVIGTNYRDAQLIAFQRQEPMTRKIVNTEEHVVETADRNKWVVVRDTPALAGCFLWAGIDYLGEGLQARTGGGSWPNVVNYEGLYDHTLNPKPVGLQRESWWSAKPVVHLIRSASSGASRGGRGNATTIGIGTALADWSPPANYTQATVAALSNCDEVELFLNGNSLGAKTLPDDAAQRVWTFPFEAGVLKAVGKNNGQIVATEELKTAGAPAKIILSADRTKLSPAFDGVAWVTATVTDANGVRVPGAENLLSFKLDGPAALLATDNGANNNTEAYATSDRKVYQGTCIALLRATAPAGKITLSATADGLAPATLTLDAASK